MRDRWRVLRDPVHRAAIRDAALLLLFAGVAIIMWLGWWWR